MRCATAMELISARLDGELDGEDAAALDRHLASCPECHTWSTRQVELNRRLRMHSAQSVPDLTDAILAGAGSLVRARRARRGALIGVAAALAAVVAGSAAVALLSPADPVLAVERVMAPEPLGTTGVVYMTIRNPGPRDRLLAASSPVASEIGLHVVTERDGVITMSAADALVCSSRLVVAPASSHLMLAGLHTELRPGDRFPLTLHFERHDPLVVDVEVVGWDELDDRLSPSP